MGIKREIQIEREREREKSVIYSRTSNKKLAVKANRDIARKRRPIAAASCCEISRTITHNRMQYPSIRESGLMSAMAGRVISYTFCSAEVPRFRREARTRAYYARKPRARARVLCRAASASPRGSDKESLNVSFRAHTRLFNLYVLVLVRAYAVDAARAALTFFRLDLLPGVSRERAPVLCHVINRRQHCR